MSNKKYTTIQIPTELAHVIDELIGKHKFSYRSRAEFVVEAIRKRIEDIQNKPKKPQEAVASV